MMSRQLAGSIALVACLAACGGGSVSSSSDFTFGEPGAGAREPGAAGPEAAGSGQDTPPSGSDSPSCLPCGQLYTCATNLFQSSDTSSSDTTGGSGSNGSSSSSQSSGLTALPGENCPAINTSSSPNSSDTNTVSLELSCGGAVRITSNGETSVIGTWKSTEDGTVQACFGVLGSNQCIVCTPGKAKKSDATPQGNGSGSGKTTVDAGN